ncbi:MAG TPA: hypothetical protein DHW61_15510 [Lachnoclostridium phytofermentans]|uniref:Uncharacterized protein n=1 Tax=Lachnoclostridium phytofermentans TaxID=66219 RepID=A0A3D2XAL9_9FIRM|nr:hypothetical protein [Lachnoclostridium phytofermentans]
MEKVPLDEYGEGNCCPNCESMKVSVLYQFPLSVEKDLNTNREILRDLDGNKIIKPSNRMLANRYKVSQNDAQLWVYECRKCGWKSNPFVP